MKKMKYKKQLNQKCKKSYWTKRTDDTPINDVRNHFRL